MENPSSPTELDLEDPNAKHSKKDILFLIATALAGGEISAKQAKEIRARLGFNQSFFTRKKADPAKKKRRAKLALVSRKTNRGTGKGQKRTGGQRFSHPKT